MGIDAEMFVRIPRVVGAPDVKRVAVQMQIALSHGVLTVDRPGQWHWAKEGRHSLNIATAEDAECYEIAPIEGGTIVRVNLSTRYYGPGYERGDLVGILAVARYLKAAFAPCSVVYGGDSGGHLRELDEEYESELWAHFTSAESRAYYSGSKWTGAEGSVRCDFCDLTANSNMSGGSYTGHYCPSCGAHWLRYSDGRIVEADATYKPIAKAVQP